MRYSLELSYRRFVKRYGFLSFARKFGDKYGKKLMNTATKVGTSKYGKKIIVQRSAEATGDLIGNKIADTITSLGKLKSKEKETNEEEEEIIIPSVKRQQIINDFRLF